MGPFLANPAHEAKDIQPSGKPLPLSKARKEGETKPGLLIRAHFYQACPDRFRQYGIEPGIQMKVLPHTEGGRLLTALRRDPAIRTLSTPTLATYSGKPASVYLGDHKTYVKGYSVQGEAGRFLVDPLIGWYDVGQSLRVLAKRVAGQVVYQGIDARTSDLLGVRTCATEVTSGLQAWDDVTWQEPVLFLGSASLPSEGCSIEVEKGGAVVLPLQYRVHHASSPTRALAKGGAVSERYESHFPAKNMSPLNLQTVVVLFATSIR
jgi:hypothetical protein